MALVEKEAETGEGHAVEPQEAPPESGGAQVIDLGELLRRSLRGGGRASEGGAAAKSAATKAAGKAPPAKKPPAAAKKRAA